jgi:hypothetical protein
MTVLLSSDCGASPCALPAQWLRQSSDFPGGSVSVHPGGRSYLSMTLLTNARASEYKKQNHLEDY